MAQLWTRVRAAVREFRISRLQRKNNSRFWVIERRRRRGRGGRKTAGRSHSLSSSSRSRVRMRSSRSLKLVFHRKVGFAGAGATSFRALTKSPATWGLTDGDDDDAAEECEDDEDERGARAGGEGALKEESLALALAHCEEEMEKGKKFSPVSDDDEDEITASCPANLDASPDWEELILASKIRTRPAFGAGEGSSSAHVKSYQWENREWRLSYRSPQLLQPVRGRLTTLSGFMKTLSDRYARRTGKLTPLHPKAARSSSFSEQPLLHQSFSASSAFPLRPRSELHPLPPLPRDFDASEPSSVTTVAGRYENPFLEFLSKSYAEKHAFAPEHRAQLSERDFWSAEDPAMRR